MKILLLSISPENYRNCEKKKFFSIEPLGLCYIKSYLESRGYESTIIDNIINNLPTERIIKYINEFKPDLIGISLSQYSVAESKKIIDCTYSKHITVCAGGSFPTLAKDALLRTIPRIDCIAIGEGERTFFDIAESINQHKDWRFVDGLCYIHNNKFVMNKSRKLFKDLDTLPFPDRTLTKKILPKHPIAIAGSRGCPWSKCTFCCTAKINKILKYPKWRCRGVNNIVDEIEYLVEKLDYNRFSFVDDCFLGYGQLLNKRASEFSKEINGRKLHIHYSIDCRPDQINLKLIKILKESGLYKIYLGVESFSRDSLKRVNKGITQEDILNSLNWCYKEGVEVEIGYIPFSCESTLNEIRENLLFLDRISKYNPGLFINILVPLYNTDWFSILKHRGILKEKRFITETRWKCKDSLLAYKYMMYYHKIISKFMDKMVIDEFAKKRLSNLLKKVHIDYVSFIVRSIEGKNINTDIVNKWIQDKFTRLNEKNGCQYN